MKWSPGDESQDIEDRRDQSGGGGFQFGGIHLGIGGAIVLLILSFIFETNLFTLLGGRRLRHGGKPAGPFSRCQGEATSTGSSRSYSMTRRRLGRSFCRSRRALPIVTPSWCFSAIALGPHAVAQRQPRVLSIVLKMRGSTLTWVFSTS